MASRELWETAVAAAASDPLSQSLTLPLKERKILTQSHQSSPSPWMARNHLNKHSHRLTFKSEQKSGEKVQRGQDSDKRAGLSGGAQSFHLGADGPWGISSWTELGPKAAMFCWISALRWVVSPVGSFPCSMPVGCCEAAPSSIKVPLHLQIAGVLSCMGQPQQLNSWPSLDGHFRAQALLPKSLHECEGPSVCIQRTLRLVLCVLGLGSMWFIPSGCQVLYLKFRDKNTYLSCQQEDRH